MQTIPLQPIANQTLQVQLNGQPCTIAVFQYAFGLFASIEVGVEDVVSSVLCQNMNRLVRDAYLGFVGDLVFVDTQGSADPTYQGLGSRWQLVYLLPSDLEQFGFSS